MSLVPRDPLPTESKNGTARVEGFNDGVFAVAMTLLIYQVEIPKFTEGKTNSELLLDLARLWPYCIALLTGFLTILIMWVNHHQMFRKVHRIDRHLMSANGILLLLITIVPFPTAMVSAFLLTLSANTACAVYAGTFAVINLAYNWLWVCRKPRAGAGGLQYRGLRGGSSADRPLRPGRTDGHPRATGAGSTGAARVAWASRRGWRRGLGTHPGPGRRAESGWSRCRRWSAWRPPETMCEFTPGGSPICSASRSARLRPGSIRRGSLAFTARRSSTSTG